MDDIISVTITPYTRVNKVDVAGTPNTYYYEKDHLWSTTKITSSTGWIIDEYSYTVFGKTYMKNTSGVYKPMSSIKSNIGNTRLYTWREYDRETNLYYLRARYYDANLGRFISRDPIGMQDNVNLYTYVANSPVGYVDRFGKEKALFIKNNEGNVWYFEREFFTDDDMGSYAHAMLYFINKWREYSISFWPTWYALEPFSLWANHDETEYLRKSIMNDTFNWNYLKIDDKYIDNDALHDYYNESFVDSKSTYNFLFNNCSDEVRRALNKAWFLSADPLIINTPDHVYNLVRNQLQYLDSISQ